MTVLTQVMEPKRLGLLHELVSGVPLVGVLLNPRFAPAARQLQRSRRRRAASINGRCRKRQHRQ